MNNGFFLDLLILPTAFALDWLIGDPRWRCHPVRIMGNAIEIMESRFRSLSINQVFSGALFAFLLIAGTFCIALILTRFFWTISTSVGFIIETILIYFCISAKDLEKSALRVYRSMIANNIAYARKELAMIVGRDTDQLSQEGVSRACVETVAENLVDGVIAPLFFAALGGAPLALAYKMTNTLDSMVGYKNEKYLLFGKVSARIDDVANYLPARLAVPLIALASKILTGKGSAAYKTAKSEGRSHTSPNAGYSEAAFAGALSIRLGGPNYYNGKLVEKPYIGSCFKKVNPGHIKQSCDLMMLSSFLTLFFLWLVIFTIRFWF
ncbi:MAG: adenosylcobinamide-phosphate synthase CbiB [Desulfobacterales bacterium]